MLSTVILSIVSILQHISFDSLYVILGCYVVLLWVSFVVWLWKDTEKRYENVVVRNIIWVLVSLTFIFGLILYLLIRPKQKDDDTYWINLERDYLAYETYGIGKCEGCGENLRPEFMVCPSCGVTLREKCPDCMQIIDIHWKICPFCAYHKPEVAIITEELPHIGVSERVFRIYQQIQQMLGSQVKIVVQKVEVLIHAPQKKEEKKSTTKIRKTTKKTQKASEPSSFFAKHSIGLKKLFFVEEKATTRK